MERIINYLPEDVLCQIFSQLNRFDLKSTSLVCKQFRSVSRPLIPKLTLKDSSLTCSDFQRLFNRFPGATNIHIDQFANLDNALLAICNSDLNLEKLQVELLSYCRMKVQYPEKQTILKLSTSSVIKSIKSLRLSWFQGQQIWQITEFINLFSSLTELNIVNGYQLQDILIYEVTLNIPNLRKISLSGSHLLTDKTLDILSSNCPKLESINFQGSSWFTPEGLYKFFCNNPQLNSVHMSGPLVHSIPEVVKCMQVLQNLNHLSLEYDFVQNEFLRALAESRPPLKSLRLMRGSSYNYTMAALIPLLSACQGLEKLNIYLPYSHFNTEDVEMSKVVKRLPKLKHIAVRYFTVVCQATLFSLVQNCPLLETIRLMSYRKCSISSKKVCDQEGMPRPTKKNYSIKSIKIDVNESDTWLLSTVEPYCPNLRK